MKSPTCFTWMPLNFGISTLNKHAFYSFTASCLCGECVFCFYQNRYDKDYVSTKEVALCRFIHCFSCIVLEHAINLLHIDWFFAFFYSIGKCKMLGQNDVLHFIKMMMKCNATNSLEMYGTSDAITSEAFWSKWKMFEHTMVAMNIGTNNAFGNCSVHALIGWATNHSFC